MSTQTEVTQLLLDWAAGDEAALEQLLSAIYEDLHRQAVGCLRHERAGHTLQPTALINEVYLKLVDQSRVRWRNRSQFFAVAAQLMRRILVDYARRRGRDKRGGGAVRVPLEAVPGVGGERDVDLVALDEALEELAELSPRQSRVVELRFFAGLTIDETAEVLEISPATVKIDWRMARAWLFRRLR
jgi:RNA polymerase sigma factor (TIGR02999 family)